MTIATKLSEARKLIDDLCDALNAVRATLLDTATTTRTAQDIVCWLLPDKDLLTINAALEKARAEQLARDGAE